MLIGLKTLGADLNSSTGWQCRPLEIRTLGGFANRVKFGRADAIGVTATDAGFLFAN